MNPDQEANRAWWECNPMTYDWENTLQIPRGSPSWFDEIDRRFFASAYFAHANSLPFGKFISPARVSGKCVLEIGCGMGTHAELLVRAGAKLTTVDQTALAVSATRERLRLRSLTADVRQQDAEALDLRDGSFDFVWSWGVIHHSSSTEACLSEVARVLRPGGSLSIMVYYRPSLVYYVHCGLIRGVLLGKLFTRSLQSIYVDASDGYYARVFTKAELYSLMATHFTDIKFKVVGLKAELFPMPRSPLKIFLESKTPDRVANAILERVGSMIVIEARKQ